MQTAELAWAKTYVIGLTQSECQEASIASGRPDQNIGSTAENYVGYYNIADWYKMRSLYRFDITTLTANETTLSAATLRLFLTSHNGSGNCTITAHGPTESWTEGGVTWNTTDGTSSWGTPGGSFGSAESTVAVGEVSGYLGHWVQWDVTNLVKAWLQGASLNNGILLKGILESGSNTLYRTFLSSNSTSQTAAYWPQLVVSINPDDDVSPPAKPGVTDDGIFTTSATSLHFVATSTDPQSGIGSYDYYIGTSPGWPDVVPGKTIDTTATLLNINETTTLALGETYYCTVVTRNGAGLPSEPGTSNGITADWTPPTQPTVTDDGATTSSGTELHASWTSNEVESGPIAEYQYSIGTAPGATNVVGWTSVGTNTSVTKTGLSLVNGTTYYFNVKARNQAGLWSNVGSSDGITVQKKYTYYFPWYDCLYMKTWILVGNPTQWPANVTVSVGGTVMSAESIPAGGSKYYYYTGALNGPVKVVADQAVFTTERSLYPATGPLSFWEVPGIAEGKLMTTYYFPWYDCQGMTTWVLVGNASTNSTAYIDLYVGTTQKENDYAIAPGGRQYFKYDGVMDGPVKVVSTNGAGGAGPLVYVTQRSIYQTSFCEVAGVASNQFSNTYYFPWYDCKDMKTWILIANASSPEQYASVEIWVGPEKRQSIFISPGSRYYAYYSGIMDGPVKIIEKNGASIIYATERSIYGSSFSEVVGIPANQLTTEYYYPWYDCQGMKTWVLVGNPSDWSSVSASIYIAGQLKETVSIAPKKSYYGYYSGLMDGPVKVTSNGQVFTTQRSIFGPSFCEVVGIRLY